ncbi:uncharacterized protein FFC1_03968 [Fusarium fujikuroi]|nr:uncharacterized protein FFC1_03968 [Fusarium fujikuroi]
MPEVEEYTIGWICALTKELIAAKAFLDVLHDPFDNAAINDDNNYTLGSIGKHNVVIAVLPYGQYGLVNAAAALKDMTRTFSNLRAVLMVGIGGGVPGTKDIRLGDIVVGSVGRNNSGVIQYDYGRAVQGEEFAVTGHLNQPPMAFLTAMSALHAAYEMEGHNIQSNIDKALQKYKRLQRKYKRPCASTDRLYKANAAHEEGEGIGCNQSCGNHNLVHRDDRGDDENNPAIHCGLIASGSSLMKDALLRDKLSAKHGILCFEMEAAGLMNHFPCVVVRGICDYADSHKNDQWQEYAAMVAAAYTKDLLLQVAPSSMLKEKRIETLLGQLNDKVEDIRQIATDNNRNIISLSSSIRDDAISRWLNPSDPSVDHNKARQVCHSGTGEWLLKSPEYLTWKSRDNSFLWLYGNSGTGKTILSSTVIEDIRNGSLPQLGNCTVLYFYITFADSQKQSLDAVLRSLINQLYRSRQDSWHPITSIYSKCGSGSSQPSTQQLKSTFRDMLSTTREAFIIIDALDEYENRSTQRGELLTWIETFLDGRANTRLLVTSRPEHDIKTSIEKWADPETIISLKTDSVGRDISEYVRNVVASSTSFRRWHGHTSTQEHIVNTLTTKGDGVFRWVALQLERLKDCINKEEVSMILQTLPMSLQETYYQVLNELTSTRRKYVIRILQFLAYSDIPLALEAAVDVLAINLTAPSGSRFSMKELIVSEGRINYFTQAGLGMKAASTSCVNKLLDTSPTGNTTVWKLNPAMHIAVEFGHSKTVALLIHKGADVNAEGKDHNVLCTAVIASHLDVGALLSQEGADAEAEQTWTDNALELVCRYGRLGIMELLNEQGADVNTPSDALSDACSVGNLNIVKLLVDKGAHVYARLESACTNGHLNIAMFCPERGAEVNARGRGGNTSLQLASRYGHLDIVEYLLEKGADINAQGGLFGTALCTASHMGNLNIVKYLVQKGADINAPGGPFDNALQAAIIGKQYETAEFLQNHSDSLRYVNMPNIDHHRERHRHQRYNLVLDGQFNLDV